MEEDTDKITTALLDASVTSKEKLTDVTCALHLAYMNYPALNIDYVREILVEERQRLKEVINVVDKALACVGMQ